MKTCLLTLGGLAAMAQAHMQMSWPPPFRSKYNPYTTDIDYSMTSPLDASGDNYPCKGYQSLYNTPQGQSVVNWQAGQTYNFTVVGTATHGGGSCQASLSYDLGATWTVVHSYIGGCPLSSNWNFALPNDTPSGDALFAWSWFNEIGNREMYMNCAHVTIGGTSNAVTKGTRSPADPYSGRPAIFTANINNGCTSPENHDTIFPNPGPDVDTGSSNLAAPIGTCS